VRADGPRGPGAEPSPRRADRRAVSAIILASLVAGAYLSWGGTLVGKDSITQFYPWYSFLGESLRAGEIPGWNPAQFSGAPFAGDPLSGWTYLPAMVFFTLLPVPAAAAGYLLFHLLLAGLSTYWLARALRIGTAGALLAAAAYELNGYFYLRSICCFAYPSVSAWFPLAILGAEMAIRASGWRRRWLWWGVAGLALSQILASWLGQGSYYALLALGAYTAYRTLLAPPSAGDAPDGHAPARRLRDRIRVLLATGWARRDRVLNLVLHGSAILLLGFGLAAAGILPRLEYHAVSNLAEGYEGIEGSRSTWGGYEVETWGKLLLPGLIYAGLPVAALALAAPLVVRARHAVPFFAGLGLAALVLTMQGPTPLHWALYLLPGLEELHPHGPERTKVVLYLAPALLAGATLGTLIDRGRDLGRRIFLPLLASGVLLFLVAAPMVEEDRIARLLLALAIVNGCILAIAWRPAWRNVAAALLVAVVAADLLGASLHEVGQRDNIDGSRRLTRVDLAEYYAPSGAALFLKGRTSDEPARYFGYGPADLDDPKPHYSRWFYDPPTAALMAINDATYLGLQGLQGYNAIHVDRYDAFMRAINDDGQNYHDADVFFGGLESPLLDLLGARYIVVPTFTDPTQFDLRNFKRSHPIVYTDERVQILEDDEALPRAWITHEAWSVDADLALKLLKLGVVDPRKTTLLETEPPKLAEPEDYSRDVASVTAYEADRIEVETYTEAPGLLTLSEVHYPAWRAYVDGEPARVYRANHLLRAVAVPAGRHKVEMRFESRALQVGLLVSGLTVAVFAAGSLFFAYRKPS
jgi:hypothetical protein